MHLLPDGPERRLRPRRGAASAGWSPGSPAATAAGRGRGDRRAGARPGARLQAAPGSRWRWSTRGRSAISPGPRACWPRPTGSTPVCWRCSPSACGRRRARAALRRPTRPWRPGAAPPPAVAIREAERNRRRRCAEPELRRRWTQHLAWLTDELARLEAADRRPGSPPAAPRGSAPPSWPPCPGSAGVTAASCWRCCPSSAARRQGRRQPGRRRAVRPRQRPDERPPDDLGRPRSRSAPRSTWPTLVATRHNPAIRSLLPAPAQAGKAKKLALTAAMRKLLVILNAMLAPAPHGARRRQQHEPAARQSLVHDLLLTQATASEPPPADARTARSRRRPEPRR